MTKHKLTNIDGRDLSVKHDIVTWSNLISVSRILITIPIIYLHIENDYQVNVTITLLILYGIVSDYLDGLVARKFDEITELGKVLDPIADKLIAFFLFGYTVWLGWIPVWYFAVGVIRDLVIMGGSVYIKWIRGKIAMAVMSGKISVNLMALYWISIFFFPGATEIHHILMIVSLVFMVFSFFQYIYRFYQIIKGADFN